MNTNTNTAPATEEMKVLGALLAAMHDNRLDGKKMREAMLWCLNSTAAQPPVPVAWRYQTPTGWHATTDAAAAMRIRAHCPIEPLYVFAAAPKATKAEPVQPERVPLTEQTLKRMHHEDQFGLFCDYDEFEQIARAIEQAQGIQPAHKEQP